MSVFSPTGADVVQQLSSWKFNSKDGWSRTESKVGMKSDIVALSNALAAAGVDHEVQETQDGGRYSLDADYASYGDTSVPLQTSWSMIGTDLEKSIWGSVLAQTAMNNVATVEERSKLKAAIIALSEGDTTFQWSAATTTDTLSVSFVEALFPETASFCSSMLGLLNQGIESYLVSSFDVKRTRIVAPSSTIVASYGRVMSYTNTSAFYTLESVPTFLMGTLPAGYWLMLTPQFEQQENGKWKLDDTWRYSQLEPSNILYTPMTS